MEDAIYTIPTNSSNVMMTYLRAQNIYQLECLLKVYEGQNSALPEELAVLEAIRTVISEKQS